jgi:hypothetical protein
MARVAHGHANEGAKATSGTPQVFQQTTRTVPQWLAHLEDEDFQFIKRLVLASGSLKELAAEYGVSYPTIRVRLDRLIARIRAVDEVPVHDPLQARIRALVANGEISERAGKTLLEAHRAAQHGGRS